MDADGDLDLFAANYVQFSPEVHQAPQLKGRSTYPGPLDYPAETNILFRNAGDGQWVDVSQSSGVAAKAGTGMGTIAGDFDDDGDCDIFVANDEMANFLYANDGSGNFEETAIYSAVAYDVLGAARGSMGVDAADYDNDGRIDLYVTAFINEQATLYRNLGQGLFNDVTPLTGAGDGTARNVTWGCSFGDLDNDGDQDLFIACGHLDDQHDRAAYFAPDLVLKNLLIESGKSRFINISDHCGDGPRVALSSRGSAVEDLDNDGDLDAVVLNSQGRATLLKNRLTDRANGQHWLEIQVRGVTNNRDGVGARIRVTAGELKLVKEVHAGRGYQSHWGSRVHFGLGPHQRVDRIEVRWLGGKTDVRDNVRADQIVTVIEAFSRSSAD
jgi:hypothetical protein